MKNYKLMLKVKYIYLRFKMKAKNGFTLIEMLIVLSVLSTLLLLAAPIQTSLIKKLQEEQFLKQFHEDVLLVQNQAGLLSKERMYIRFFEDSYIVIHGRRGNYEVRKYPEGWKFSGSNTLIEFKETGTITSPRRVLMYKDGERVAFTFPFGKGRFYIE